jgi:hypothetical protein
MMTLTGVVRPHGAMDLVQLHGRLKSHTNQEGGEQAMRYGLGTGTRFVWVARLVGAGLAIAGLYSWLTR